jgi:hypothetical protein
MTNHSLVNASRNTHAKITILALAVSVVFVALVSATGVTKPGAIAQVSGPAIKASTLMNVATSERTLVR